MVTYFNKVFSIKKYEAVFLKRPNLDFPIAAGSIAAQSCFLRINILPSKISNLLSLRAEGARARANES